MLDMLVLRLPHQPKFAKYPYYWCQERELLMIFRKRHLRGLGENREKKKEKKNKTEENYLVVIGRFASTVIVIENNHSRRERVYS